MNLDELLAKEYGEEPTVVQDVGRGESIQTEPSEVRKRKWTDIFAKDYGGEWEQKAQGISELEQKALLDPGAGLALPTDIEMAPQEPKGVVQSAVDAAKNIDPTGLIGRTDAALGKLFHLYQRGQYGVAGAANALAQGRSPLEGAYEGFVEGVPSSWIDYFNTIAPSPWMKGLNVGLGLTMDIATDPVNYITPTVTSKVYDLLGMGRLFQAIEGLPPIDRASKTVRKLFEKHGEMHGFTGAKELFKGHELAQENITRYVLNEVEDRFQTFIDTANELGFKDPKQLLRNSYHFYQQGKKWAINDDLWKLLEKDVHWYDELWAKEVQAGHVDVDDYVTNYLPHLIKDEESGKYFGGIMSWKNPNGVFYSKPKKYDTLDELQTGIDQIAEKGWLPKDKDYKTVDNWYEALGVRAWVSEMAREQMRFTDEILGRFGLPVSSLKQFLAHQKGLGEMDPGFDLSRTGWVAVVPSATLRKHYGKTLAGKFLHEALGDTPDLGLLETLEQRGGSALVPILTGGMGTKSSKIQPLTLDEQALNVLGKSTRIVPLEVYEAFKQNNNFYISNEWVKKAYQGWQTGMRMWKTMATSFRLPFHERNVIGNQASLMMAGMNPIDIARYNAKAFGLQRGKGEYFGLPAKEFLAMSDRVGARGYGFVGADIPSRFGEELQKVLDIRTLPEKMESWGAIDALVKEPAKALATKARAFGAMLEDNSRLSLLIWEMERLGANDLVGQTPRLEELAKRATAKVNKHLHDYTDLSGFEKSVAKNIWPFYTFMKKNLVRHLEALYMNPAYYSRLGKYRDALYPLVFGNPPETGTEKLVKTQRDEDMRLHKTKWSDENGNPIYSYVDLPVEQLRMFTEPMEFLRSTSPVFALGQIAMNTANWPKPRPIDDGKRVPAPFWINWLGKPEDGEKWHSLMNYGPMIDPRTKKPVMGISPQWKVGLETAFPFLREWTDMFPQANSVVVEDQGKWKALSYLTGIRFTPMDVQRGMLFRKLQRGNPRHPNPDSYLGKVRSKSRNLGRSLTEEEKLELKREVFR